MTAPQGSPAPSLGRGAAWALALTATLTMAVSYVDRQVFAVLAPTVTTELHISESALGWLFSAFSMAYLVGAPIAGLLIDRVGARRGLLGAVLVWSAVAALHALVPAYGVLFALRIALGLAEAPSFPGAAQTVHRALPPAERARGLGVLFTGSSIGAMLAPKLATTLNAHFGWRFAFLGTAAAGLIWVPVWLRVAFSPASRRALDGDAAARAPEPSYRDSAAEPPPQAAPRWLDVLRHPAVLRGVVVVLGAAPLIGFVLNWGAKYLVKDHGLSQDQVSEYLWCPPLFFDAGAILFGHFASKRAALTRGAPERGLLGASAALTACAALVPFVHGPWPAILVAGVSMAGGGGLFALLTADMLSRVPPAAVSTAGGISAAAQSLAYIVAMPIVGRSVERTGSYREIIIALGLWVVAPCLVWILWRPPSLHPSSVIVSPP